MMKYKTSIQTMNSTRIIAIDPGYDRVGVAVLEKKPGAKEIVLYSTCITTNQKQSIAERIFVIGTEIARVISEYTPVALAIEKLYFTTNQKTAMGVSEARGVIIYEALRAHLTLFEYTPIEIKVAVTGYGKATKDAVHLMINKLVSLEKQRRFDDEIDAIAIGLTCLAREKFK